MAKKSFIYKTYNPIPTVGDKLIVQVDRTGEYGQDSRRVLTVAVQSVSVTRIKLVNGMSFPYRKTKIMELDRDVSSWEHEHALLFCDIDDYHLYMQEKDYFDRSQKIDIILNGFLKMGRSLSLKDMAHLDKLHNDLKKIMPEYFD